MNQRELAGFMVAMFAAAHQDEVLISGVRPLVARVRRMKSDHSINRFSGKPQAPRPGIVTLRLADEACIDLMHPNIDVADAWFIVRVRRDVLDRMASPIIQLT